MSRPDAEGAALIDVNVLIAAAWPSHVHHRPAKQWFTEHSARGWATTPVTELGFVRVSSNRVAVRTRATPAVAMRLLEELTAQPGHEFWPDDLRLVVGKAAAFGAVTTHRAVTDAHLLALADRYRGRLVTFDRGITRLLDDRPGSVLDVLEPAQPSPIAERPASNRATGTRNGEHDT